MWKTGPSTRTKPVIARDTTYCVSLLTCTIGGSNLTLPNTKIPPRWGEVVNVYLAELKGIDLVL